MAWSRTLPVFTVPFEEAMHAYQAICPDAGGAYDSAARDHYLSLFGWRYALANAGLSLALGALTGLIGLAALAFGSWHRMLPSVSPSLRTPTRRWQFLALGVLAIFLFWQGSIAGLGTDLRRQYFPACADSIAIPIAGMTITTLILLPIFVLIGFLLTRGFGVLPATLAQWDQEHPRKSWAVSAIFVLFALLNIAALASSFFSSDIILPAGVLTTYLLLATRAALLAPQNDNIQ